MDVSEEGVGVAGFALAAWCVDSPIGARPCGRASWVGSPVLHDSPSMDREAEAL